MQIKSYLSVLFLLLPALVFASNSKPARIFVTPLPSIYIKSDQFLVSASGINIPVVKYDKQYDYANFSASKGFIEISITLLNEGVEIFNISPKKLNISAVKKGNQLIFTLKKDGYLILKINNKKELVIAADAEETDKPPANGKGIFNVLDRIYAADSSGKSLTTNSLQKAVNDAAVYNGGIVYVPAGVYKIGNLELKSNMSLYLESGAVLLFSGIAGDYTVNARKASQNRNITWWIYTSSGAHDVKLYGRGILDGNGKNATEKGKIGNHILAIMNTDRFLLDGLTIRESGAWAIIPTRSRNVTLRNFKLFNRFDMGENDGVDVMESENVLVQHAIGIALDDPFSTKTWQQDTDLCRNWPGVASAQNNVVFEDCISWTYCYGFKIGQGVMQPQSNISFKNCVVYDAAVGIGIHHKWGTACVKNVVFDGIDIEKLGYQNDDHRTWGIFFMQNGDHKGSGPISDILVKNITVRDRGKSPGKIKGASEISSISNLTFKNVKMPGSIKPATNLKEINMTDVTFANQIKVL